MKAQFLDVLVGETLVGRLSKIGDVIQFIGEPAYLEDPERPTLSLSYNSLAPLIGETITRTQFTRKGTQWTRAIRGVPAFFENLLPEGALLDWLAAKRGVAPQDQFDLLAATGHDLPGAIVIQPSDLEAAQGRLHAHSVDGDEDTEVERTAEPIEGAFSLAGQQMKLAVSIVEKGKRYTLRTKLQEGQEIIAKLPSFHRSDVVEVEFAGMTLARLAGVEVPEFWMEDTSTLDVENVDRICPRGVFLAIERFDRPQAGASLHMEDWCQINGRRPMMKYAGEDSYVQALRAIHQFSSDRFADAAQFFCRQTANILMGNTDAHLKNFAFVYPDRRTPRLSPAYDMVPIIAYLGTGQYLLNEKIEAQYQTLTIEDFKRVGAAARFAPKAIEKMVRDTVSRIRDEWPVALQSLPIDERLQRMILERLDRIALVKSLSGSAPKTGLVLRQR